MGNTWLLVQSIVPILSFLQVSSRFPTPLKTRTINIIRQKKWVFVVLNNYRNVTNKFRHSNCSQFRIGTSPFFSNNLFNRH